ncbi:MAG TPA: penicillin-binding protein 2, partial [Chthoniobacteraceae bacterium]|nr:penicillin-binding protein 2 [Chthoniobacteraceae bacterium]
IEDVDFPTIAKYSEHDVGLPGVEIAVKPVRQYLYGAMAAHILGYVGMPKNIKDLPDADDYEFYQPDVQGKTEVEAAMDDYLRGTPGVRVMQRNLRGVIDTEVSTIPPKPGNNVYLTIDARIQYICEDALRAVPRGAVVVVNPNNGDILGMASVPSYDPNKFIPGISAADFKALTDDDDLAPLYNRAVRAYPPGSTFKIVTALAGLRKKMGGNSYTCNGSYMIGNRPFHCWIAAKGGAHGTIGLTEALKVSCDCYFYQYGIAAGIDSIDQTAEMLGLGEKPGLDLSEESSGVIPSPDWLAQHSNGERWGEAQTANSSIGQGYDLASPLQMAMAYATVANGGISYYPRLVRTVLTPEGKPLLGPDGQPVVPDEPKVRADLRNDFSKADIDLVRLGLWKVVNDPGGTGASARLKSVVVAGKTGTAQAWRGHTEDDVAWFCCFAPYDKPRYAICAMVNGGMHGGSVATPIAARILDQCVAMDNGTFTPDLKPLPPAHSDHPYEIVQAVVYKNGPTALGGPGGAAPEDETHDNDNPHAADSSHRQMAQPDIRPDPDAQGQVSRIPAPQPTPDRRNIFQKLFNSNRTATPTPTPHPPAHPH